MLTIENAIFSPHDDLNRLLLLEGHFIHWLCVCVCLELNHNQWESQSSQISQISFHFDVKQIPSGGEIEPSS